MDTLRPVAGAFLILLLRDALVAPFSRRSAPDYFSQHIFAAFYSSGDMHDFAIFFGEASLGPPHGAFRIRSSDALYLQWLSPSRTFESSMGQTVAISTTESSVSKFGREPASCPILVRAEPKRRNPVAAKRWADQVPRGKEIDETIKKLEDLNAEACDRSNYAPGNRVMHRFW